MSLCLVLTDVVLRRLCLEHKAPTAAVCVCTSVYVCVCVCLHDSVNRSVSHCSLRLVHYVSQAVAQHRIVM